MKFLAVLLLAVACVMAEPSLTEWKAEYGAFPTGHVMSFKPEAPMYYRLAPYHYTIPSGFRVAYDPEHFNDAFGFYPAYKK